MNSSEIISIVALGVSGASLVFSGAFNLRDRSRLVTKSQHFPHRDGTPASMRVSIVNAGRRPVVLRMWGGSGADGNWIGTLLGEMKSGLRLAEHEHHEFTLRKDDLLLLGPEEDVEISDIWFEDTLGRRHVVKEAKKNIAKLRA